MPFMRTLQWYSGILPKLWWLYLLSSCIFRDRPCRSILALCTNCLGIGIGRSIWWCWGGWVYSWVLFLSMPFVHPKWVIVYCFSHIPHFFDGYDFLIFDFLTFEYICEGSLSNLFEENILIPISLVGYDLIHIYKYLLYSCTIRIG